MTIKPTITDILNDLITINKDHIIGHKEAIHDMNKNQHKIRQLLKAMVEQSENFIEELKEKIKEFGGEVTDKTITSGLVYNTWMDIVYSDAGSKPEIRHFCDQIEDMTLQAYDSALMKLKDLDENTYVLVFRQKQELVKFCNEVKNLQGD